MSTHNMNRWKLSFNIIKWATTWQNQQSEFAPSEDSDQPWHPPSLIRVFAVRMKKPWVLSYPLSTQRRLWSDWADALADLSLRWAHTRFVGFVMSQLKYPPYLFFCLLLINLKNHLSHDTTKRVLGSFRPARHKPACAATEASYRHKPACAATEAS